MNPFNSNRQLTTLGHGFFFDNPLHCNNLMEMRLMATNGTGIGILYFGCCEKLEQSRTVEKLEHIIYWLNHVDNFI